MTRKEAAEESSVHFEPPDMCVWTFVGDVDVEILRALIAEQVRHLKGLPISFALVDVSRLGSFSGAAREEAGRKQEGVNIRATAYVGASFPIRVIAILVATASRVLHKMPESPVRFFNSRAEALAWLSERRAIERGATNK